MFPSVEDVVIEAVLETHAHKPKEERLEKAIEDLLQLTDPDYKVSRAGRYLSLRLSRLMVLEADVDVDDLRCSGAKQPDSTASHSNPVNPQTNLDEEFARSLQIAEERQAEVQARSEREVGSSLSGSTGGLAYQPRAPRGGRTSAGAGVASQSHQGFDGYDDAGHSTTGYDSYGRPIETRQGQDHNPTPTPTGRFGGLWSGEPAHQDSSMYGPGGGAGGGQPSGPGIEEKIGKYAEVGKQTLDKFLFTARTKVNEFEQLQTQRQAGMGGQVGGITGTLGGMFNDAKAVATGRRDGVGAGAGAGGYQGQGQGQGGFGAGVGSAFSGLSGLFGGRVGGAGQQQPSQHQQYQGQQHGSSWSNPAQNRGPAQNARGGALNTSSSSSGPNQTAGSRRWQPTDIFGESRRVTLSKLPNSHLPPARLV